MVMGIVPDYMHGVLLGVTKTLRCTTGFLPPRPKSLILLERRFVLGSVIHYIIIINKTTLSLSKS